MAKAKRRTRRKPQSKAGNSMWLWGFVGLATVAGLYAYQHRKEMPSMLAHAGAVAGMPHLAQEAWVPASKPKVKTAATRQLRQRVSVRSAWGAMVVTMATKTRASST